MQPPETIVGSFPLMFDVGHESEPVDKQRSEPTRRIDGVVIGTLAGFDAAERPCIDLPAEAGAATGLLARSTAVVRPCDVGRQVAVMFEAGDPTRPVILGLLQESPTAAHIPQPTPGGPAWQVEADGQHVTVQAAETLVFRCGDASITLTKAGKIILRGTYLLSRSSGVNRIKGGAVQIN